MCSSDPSFLYKSPQIPHNNLKFFPADATQISRFHYVHFYIAFPFTVCRLKRSIFVELPKFQTFPRKRIEHKPHTLSLFSFHTHIHIMFEITDTTNGTFYNQMGGKRHTFKVYVKRSSSVSKSTSSPVRCTLVYADT